MRVMVLDAGRLKEFDAPYTLLKNPRTTFAQLVAQTGPTESRKLFDIARQKYYSKKTIPETQEDEDQMERSAVIQEIAKPNKELVDGFQSLTAATVIVPNGTGSERQPEFQFESTV
ncbi:hypothetical protein OS493_018177 [Desmophyllum pertusum]|uniref:Uncharacterized protein n=1 Tax=Desmophyllum pertusum TaxID=174260 RepID=A0A9W9YRL8_9CNID|nr:hypothetical protein OS493_018177 [Desmophyllum pertusum]